MLKLNYFVCLLLLATSGVFAQSDVFWSAAGTDGLTPSKNVSRDDFPEKFSSFSLNTEVLLQALSQAPVRKVSERQTGVTISIPNAEGNLEVFEVLEASNFAPGLQAAYPNLRAYVGKGKTDKGAILRLSVGTKGVSGMILRSGTGSEFIERYAADAPVYVVYNSRNKKGGSPFVCGTEDQELAESLEPQALRRSAMDSNGELMTFRLALSCNGQYTQYHGNSIAGALEAMNATMTRVNGVFERDLAVHLTIIENNTAVIYTNPNTDPYSNTNMNAWNGELQETLTDVIGEANYDIGHMFGASGGGGNAGCIGCVCVNNQKGSGITSPSNGIPEGDTFDIDYVAHEMGHQLGGTHTYSAYNEGTGTNVEPGSGSTIMGYAGIVPGLNVQNNSDDYFVYVSILQIEANLANKTCPVRETIIGSNPVADAGSDYITPYSTPFILTGASSDPDGDLVNYCWENSDNVTGNTDGNNSECSPTKASGPNFRSYDPAISASRTFPRIQSVVANNLTTTTAGFTSEAISSVARELNFALTVRDAATGVGRTSTDFMKVDVTTAAGPFLVSSPNTNAALVAGTNHTVTWDVAGTTANGVDTPYVDIYMSTNGGTVYPILLASQVPNDGSETITIPNQTGNLNRVMVRGHNHIFFDISNANFPITAPSSSFSVAFSGVAGEQNKAACQGGSVSYTLPYSALAGFTGATTFALTGQPAGSTVTFSPATMTQSGEVTLTVTTASGAPIQLYGMTVTATSGSTVRTVPLYLDLENGSFEGTTLLSPANNALGQSVAQELTWSADAAATSYLVEVATDAGFTNIIQTAQVSETSYFASGLLEATGYFWRVQARNSACEGNVSSVFYFMTGQTECNTLASSDVPKAISANGAPTVTSTLVVEAGAPISRLTVNTTINHTYVSDLTVRLTSPEGTQVILLQNPCEGQNNINATFDDLGGAPACANNPAVSGLIQPVDALSAFIGENPEGTWTLTVSDGFNQDGGSLTAWSLNICSEQLGTEDQHLTDLSIYPNPNNGSFQVAFTPTASAVKVQIFDIRGRNIFGQTYQSNGLFNQVLDLNHPASGVYLVQIENGGVTETRKIVVR